MRRSRYLLTSTGRRVRRELPENRSDVIMVRESEKNGARVAVDHQRDRERLRNIEPTSGE